MCKKDLNNQPLGRLISPWLVVGRGWHEKDYLKDGLLRMPDRDGRRNQELHNASHAAWMLYMVVFDLIHEKHHRNTGKRANRILAHLSCMREFLEEDDLRFRVLLRRLIKSIKRRFPNNSLKWAVFVVQNWALIRKFAAHYEFELECFPESYYGQICCRLNEMLHQMSREKSNEGKEFRAAD